ncbi:MAG: hypothetical protein GX580_01775 [Candidatus Hydrogenedens sp.]|nr:hypothetical protein [Candidatus Hydrogenedens sp.]
MKKKPRHRPEDRWEISGSLTPQLERAPRSHMGVANTDVGDQLPGGDVDGSAPKKRAPSQARAKKREGG